MPNDEATTLLALLRAGYQAILFRCHTTSQSETSEYVQKEAIMRKRHSNFGSHRASWSSTVVPTKCTDFARQLEQTVMLWLGVVYEVLAAHSRLVAGPVQVEVGSPETVMALA